MTAVDLPALSSGDELEEPLRFLVAAEVHALADAALPGCTTRSTARST